MPVTDEGSDTIQPLEDEQELRRLNDAWVEALVGRDTGMLDRVMASDFVFIYPLDGDGKDRFIADVQSGDLIVESLVRDNVDIRIFENTAVISSIDNAKWRYKGHNILGYYRMINVYANRRGQWQLVTIQACPIALDH